MSQILSKRGYGLSKTSITNEEAIKNELTVKPNTGGYDDGNATQFKVFIESSKKLYVPKCWGLKKFGVPEENTIAAGTPISCEFTGELRDYQLEPIKSYMQAANDPSKRGGILQLPPGWGKTVMALHILCKLKVKTLIIVHKEFLLNQWKERIEQYMTNVNVGIIKQNRIEFDNDVVIASLQSLSMRTYEDKVLDGFGLVISDECFPNDVLVHTDNGVVSIGSLYEQWKIRRQASKYPSVHVLPEQPPPKILSYNRKTEKFEYKALQYAWRKERKDLIEIKLGNSDKMNIHCTPEHKILTTEGYIEGIKLTRSHSVICKYDTDNLHGTLMVPVFTPSTFRKQSIRYGTLRVLSVIPYENTECYVYDIEVQDNHNFVIGNKDGFVEGPVVSNCHHLSAQVFSRALFKVNFTYALGLSATVTRKDGLSKVFKWFLGDVIYKAKPKKEPDALRVIMKYYNESNNAYSQVPVLYNGKPNFSRMINNVCEYAPRTKLIVDEITQIMHAEPERNLIILSDRRKHLNDFETALREVGFDSIAYYVGGMKEKDLKLSQEAKILLGTYNMVSEGFDLPKLNTLVLASPKSDVEQSIGRIQRQLKADRQFIPLVLDIVDQFSLFTSQGNKRRAFYTKKGFELEEKSKITANNDKFEMKDLKFSD